MKKRRSARKSRRLRRFLRHLAGPFLQEPLRLFSLIIILIFFYSLPGNSYYETLKLEFQPPLVRASELENFAPSPYPEKVGQEVAPYLTAESVVITDLNSAVPMFELNPTERLRPASVTKLMTALVALNYYQDLDQVISVNSLATVKDESDMGLVVGDKLSVRNLISGLLIPSGNDAAYILAINYPGGIEQFVSAMNQTARQLHMTDTHFDNPSGFDSPNHYTSAHDLSLLTAVALENDLIKKLVSTRETTLNDASGKKLYKVKNVNDLLGYVYGVDGVKTGFTDEAGQCLVSSVSRDGHHIVIVLLHIQDRFGESANLIGWVFRNFQWKNFRITN